MTIEDAVEVCEEVYREISEKEERPRIGFLLGLQYMLEEGGELYE